MRLAASACLLATCSGLGIPPAWLPPTRSPSYPPPSGELVGAAAAARVARPLARAPHAAWKTAWRIGKRVIPMWHAFEASPSAADTDVNLSCLWWKALAERQGHIDDGGVAFDLLPSVTRRAVAWPLCLLYPPLHSQTVALRTAFIDACVAHEVARPGAPAGTARVVVLGSGLDGRSVAMGGGGDMGEWYEIDRPAVVATKRAMLQRLIRRRRRREVRLPRLIGADLAEEGQAEAALAEALGTGTSTGRVVVVIEALLIYIAPEAARRLLEMVIRRSREASEQVSIVYADRLPGVKDEASANALWEGLGCDVIEWAPKPGLARHMGRVRVRVRRLL